MHRERERESSHYTIPLPPVSAMAPRFESVSQSSNLVPVRSVSFPSSSLPKKRGRGGHALSYLCVLKCVCLLWPTVRARTASVSSAGQGSDQKCEVAGSSATPAGPKETSKAPVSEGTGAERGKGGGRPVKCSACLIACDGPAHYRTHVRSEWHLLNVKRKVREMRPLSEDEFSKMSEKDVTAFLAVES